jgi:surface carbohydrate biosynthesis protein
MEHVSHLFAWGEDSAELWRQYPEMPSPKPIHVTGNPRNDLLRAEISVFYEKEVERLKESFGEFILVNTNFNHVNAFSKFHNLFQPVTNPDELPQFGEAAKGMSREYAEGLRAHKQSIFEGFQQLIPELERAFPDYTIVVRPHPTENQEVYHQIAAQCERVRVTNEGNVVPWLMAARVLIHNGCTTGVEAYVMKVPSVSYRIAVDEAYDLGFYRLPNLVSHQCFSFKELRATLEKILSGVMGPAGGDERKAEIDRYLAALDGPLACERIVDVLDTMRQEQSRHPKPSLSARLDGWYRATKRMVKKRINAYRQDSLNRPEFQRHRYPGISLQEVRERMFMFREVLGEGRELKAEQISDRFFKIMPWKSS